MPVIRELKSTRITTIRINNLNGAQSTWHGRAKKKRRHFLDETVMRLYVVATYFVLILANGWEAKWSFIRG